MKINRTKNAMRNITFGLIFKIYKMVVPFLVRSAIIYWMGVEYLGLDSLFTSILQVLNLAELGVGSAMVYSMYKPIAEDDQLAICALLKLYRNYYHVIGLVILIAGGVITPFIPKLISGDIPDDINIYVLYLLNLGATVLSYWMFAYRNSLLLAHQRTDITNKVLLITNTIQYALQLTVLFIFRNYYCYVIILLLTQVLTTATTALVTNKLYPKYKPVGEIDNGTVKQINKRIRDLFTAKIGGVVYNSVDTIVISAFLGLTELAIYQNYFYVALAPTSLIGVIFYACTAGVGNSIVTETKQKNLQDFNKFTMIICWLAGFCSVCMLCIYQPFMELWVGKDLMLSFSAVICFVTYFFVRQLNSLYTLYKDASGMWHEDRLRPLAASLTNLILNLILVQFIGIYGILISTVVAILVVGIPWLLRNLFTVIFERKYMWIYLKKVLFYVLIVAVSCVVTYFVCSFINLGLIATILLRGIICVILPNVIYYVAYRKTNEFGQLLVMVDHITKGRFKKLLMKL